MKTLYRLFSLSMLALAVQSPAAFESARFDPNNELPRFPVAMQAAGITKGSLIVATSISAEGAITDTLVLGYTNSSLIRPSIDMMKRWKVTPARLDGEPVPVQVVLTFDFALEGAVITTNIVNHFLYDNLERWGDGAFAYRVYRAKELDQRPELISPIQPKYAVEAEKQGIRGKVQVEFYIDEQGAVRMPSIKTMTHPYLAEQAVAAVRGWKFSPPTHNGEPVLVAASQEFEFGDGK